MARHTAKSHKIRKVEILVIQIGIFRTKYFIRLMRFKKGGLDMKILKSILNYIPLATFIIFVVTDGIFSLTSALIFVISTIGLLIGKEKTEMKN